MAKAVRLEEGVVGLLRDLMEAGIIEAVVTLRSVPQERSVVWSLVPLSEALSSVHPWFPSMPQNGAKVVSRLSKQMDNSYRLGVVLRPCEIRALRELAKLGQTNLDCLLIIGLECLGVFPLERIFSKETEIFQVERDYLEHLRAGEDIPDIRAICRACENPLPDLADLGVWARGQTSPLLLAHSPKGARALETMFSPLEEVEIPAASYEILSRRGEEAQRMRQRVKETIRGFKGLTEIFGPCIGCHNCRSVCPLCYCRNCFFTSACFDYPPEVYLHRLQHRRITRLPLDSLLFHLGRMTHMAGSCVACGMCEDVCPAAIPIAQVFKTIGAEIQQLFGYEPGKRLDEPMPLVTFRTDEFQDIGG